MSERVRGRWGKKNMCRNTDNLDTLLCAVMVCAHLDNNGDGEVDALVARGNTVENQRLMARAVP